jgi:hypothetical protein
MSRLAGHPPPGLEGLCVFHAQLAVSPGSGLPCQHLREEGIMVPESGVTLSSKPMSDT